MELFCCSSPAGRKENVTPITQKEFEDAFLEMEASIETSHRAQMELLQMFRRLFV